MNIKPYLKALGAGLIAAVAFLTPALDDDDLSKKELAGIAGAFVTAAVTTYFVPYQSTKPSTEAKDGNVTLF